MRLYIIAGEASGDLHGSNLIKSLLAQNPALKIRCWGGDRMRDAGGELVKHYRELAFMGFTEVLINLRTIFRNIAFCKKDIEEFNPDAVVFIDYPGFNMRIAEWAKKKGIRTYYYISPQIWAWKEKRVEKIRRDVDRMFVVLPFEKEFYHRHGVEVDFVGHPLLDEIEMMKKTDLVSFCSSNNLEPKPIIALLPGSRKQEISIVLPLMMSVLEKFPEQQFVIAGAPSVDENFYQNICGDKLKIVFEKTYELMQCATAGLVTSGTATLEAGLQQMPQVVCYKGSAVSYWIARKLVKVKFISLVNLVLDREVVRELIQHDLNHENILAELRKIVSDTECRKKMDEAYIELREKLGGPGASQKTANLLLKNLEEHRRAG